MKKIFLSTSNIQPIPAVHGGATETLIDILIRENEVEKKCFFYILCKYDELAELKARHLKYTRIIYFKSIKDASLFELLTDKEVYVYLMVRVLNFFGIIKTVIPPRYYFFAYRMCKKLRPDYFVAEGGMYELYEMLSEIIPRDRRYAHLHRVVNGYDKFWSIFPNAIACSNYVKNAYIGQARTETLSARVVKNCCNEILFKEEPEKKLVASKKSEFGFNDDDFVVIFSGRVVQEKGVKELIEAIAKIHITNIKLLIIGSSFFANSEDTEYWLAIQRQAAFLGKRVVMAGYVPNNELSVYFAMSSLCVVPSVWEEPVALVPLEAMTYGVPVLVTDSGGMVEYQKNGCIAIVKREPDLAVNLSDAIVSLYKDHLLRQKMVVAGKKRASEFSCKGFYNEFLQVFN